MKQTTPELGTNAAETSDRLKRRRMRNRVVPLREKVAMSFEFFPARDEAAARRMGHTVDVLTALGPRFLSVTYGALGAQRDKSIAAVSAIMSRSTAPVAAHLTCVGATVADIDAALDAFLSLGVTRFVALRGDLPKGTDCTVLERSGYRRADQLVAAIRRRGDFDISVATYPEKHPESRDLRQDIDALLAKQDAGATRAITQFFFDTDRFLRFRDDAVRAGVRIPIVPGVLPVHHFANTCRFAGGCGAVVPEWMHQLFNGLDDAPEVREMVATTVATEQCARLIEHGVDHLHFYTLNRSELTAAICRILGLGDGGQRAGGAAGEQGIRSA